MEFPNIEYWLKVKCPQCGAYNWVWFLVRNEAVSDVDAFKCFSCGNCFWLDKGSQEMAADIDGITDPSEAMGLESGREIPG